MKLNPGIVSYIALGSNLNNPIAQLKQAITELHHLPQTQFITASNLYANPPLGPKDQPDFVNAVVKIVTDLSAQELLTQLQMIETIHGRVREKERWGPRSLDLDLILYGSQTIRTECLTVPHPGLKERAFVVIPLVEIAPDLILPDGTVLAELSKLHDKQLLRCL